VTDPDEDFAPPPPRSRLRRLRKVVLWVFGVCATIALVLYLGRWQVGRVGAERLRIETARLDAAEPDWKLDAVFAERQKQAPPDARTAATEILRLAESLPDDWKKWRNSDDAMSWLGGRCDNHLRPKDTTDIARKHAADTFFLRGEAIRLRDRPPGHFPVTLADDPIGTLLPHLDSCRQLLSLLQYDAYLAVLDKNPNRAISAARGALAVGRTIGDEPLLISQLVRIASVVLAAQTAMQVIAWGEPTDGLAELQAELLTEAEVPYFQIGMRGERAVLDRVFRGLEDGTIPPEHWFRYAEVGQPGPEHYAAFKTYRAFIPGDHAKTLEITTKYLDAAKLPYHEQLAAMNAVPIPRGPPEDFRYILTRLLLPACQKVAEAGLRARAELLAAATGVACERYRQKHGRLPQNPAELVPTFLPAVPLNPFDGKPISYRVSADRVAVYFFWADSPRKVQDLPEDFRDGPPGAAFGYRLWNPDRRGLPAEEKKDP
jgi:hypothetical protein